MRLARRLKMRLVPQIDREEPSLTGLCAALDAYSSELTLKRACRELSAYEGKDWVRHVEAADEFERSVKEIYVGKRYTLVLINWGENARTRVHNHPEKGAAIRVVLGTLMEQVYTPIGTYGVVNPVSGRIERRSGATWGIHNDDGTHRLVTNAQAATLHLYLPCRQQCQACANDGKA